MLQIVSSSLILLLMACVSPNAAEPPPFRTIAKGSVGGIDEAKREVIKDKAAWEKLWTKHTARSRPADKVPEVDFSKDMVVIATLGRQRTGGYSIEIVGVQKTSDRLKISVKRTAPPPGGFTTQALTAPFHFVTVPRSDLKPEFVEAKASE